MADRVVPTVLARAEIVYRRTQELKDSQYRLKVQTDMADMALAALVKKFRAMSPIVIDQAGVVIHGAKRLRVARMLGIEEVPTVLYAHLSPDELSLFAIADNETTAMSPFDMNVLELAS